MDHWCYRSPKVVSPGIYTEADVALLAETDALHSTRFGPATGTLRRRAAEGYGDARYERLAGFSVGHLYNLRKRAGYLARRQYCTKTKGTSVSIGERSAPHIRFILFIPNDRRALMTPIQAQTLGVLVAIITLLLLRVSYLLWLQCQDVARSDCRRDAQRKP